MTESSGFSFHGDLSSESEIYGIESALDIAARYDTETPLNTDDQMRITAALAPGFAHLHDLVFCATQLANEGNIVGALRLMGGPEKARQLIGDEAVDELLVEFADQPNYLNPDLP